jgi:membrane protein involved in colicin uptake
MKKIITLAAAGIFLLGLQTAGAQKEVAPPAVPPMLEGQRPLATPEAKEPAAPQKTGEEKVKTTKAKGKAKAKAKATAKTKSKTVCKKSGDSQKKASQPAKKSASKATKIKKPPAEPAAPAAPGGPDEG